MSNSITPEEAVSKIELENIVLAMSKLAMKIMTLQKIEEKEYQVTISIPVELAEVFEYIASNTSVPIEKILSEFGKDGFNRAVQAKLQENIKQQVPPPSPSPFNDLEKLLPGMGPNLMQGLNKMKDMAEKLEGFQKVMEDAIKQQNPKDSK